MNDQLDNPRSRNELVYEGGDLDWITVATTVGDDKNIYGLRRCSSSSRSLDQGKKEHTTSSNQTQTLIDEEYEERDMGNGRARNFVKGSNFKRVGKKLSQVIFLCTFTQ